MRRPDPFRATGALAGWLAAAVAVSLGVVMWFGYRGMQRWQLAEERLAHGRSRETVDLLVTALSRDMRGVQTSVLPASWEDLMLDSPEDLRTLVASAFARYPYPESFFAWRRSAQVGSMSFFNRSDRPPAWMRSGEEADRFPVSVIRGPDVERSFRERIDVDAAHGRRFSAFELELAGVRYQVVARLFYGDAYHERLQGVFGFTVNLPWTRAHYFPEVARQVARIGSGPATAIVDDHGLRVAGGTRSASGGPVIRRWFPVAFFDPLAAGVDVASDPSYESWAVQAELSDDPTLAAALLGATRTLEMAAVAALALVLGLWLTARAARASARVAGMRSDFVSTVTHELKTPIATIRAIGETLVRGRVVEPAAQRDYAQLVVQESKRLTRLVENLLAYARITDVTEAYAFESLDLRELVEEVLSGFRAQLLASGFEVSLDLPPDLPPVKADRTALRLALDNLVDNSIRYSDNLRWLAIAARRGPAGRLTIEVRDRGAGIPVDEIGEVTRRFVRGRRARSGGSGLGLAIVQRIAADHGGSLVIESTPGEGTTVRLTLPEADER